MAWARVDDQWWCHPKVMGLSLAASGLWARALSWTCMRRTPVVADSFVHMVAGADTDALTKELEDADLWVRVEEGWEIHDWSQYQDLSLSEKRAEAGRKGAEKRWQADSKPVAIDEPETGQPQGDPPDPEPPPENGKPVATPMAGSHTHTHTQSHTQSELLPSVVTHAAPAEKSDRPRNEVWDTLADLFGDPTTDSNRKLRGKLVASLSRAGATTGEIRRRVSAWPLHFPEATLTETALEKHWDRLATVPARATKGQARQLERELDRRETQRRILGGEG